MRKEGASKFLALLNGVVPAKQYQDSGNSFGATFPVLPPAGSRRLSGEGAVTLRPMSGR
jgi:hypothetical protein